MSTIPLKTVSVTDVCPPRHVSYLSETLALNAATIHAFANERCPGIRYWPCQDHWHIGHERHSLGLKCLGRYSDPFWERESRVKRKGKKRS